MKIVSIEVTNWRAYSFVQFDFSRTSTTKNCVLIGAKNGYGKTSFFEAITLCLYGKAGVPLLARAEDQVNEKRSISYDKFMGSVVHKGALNDTPARVSVKIVFERTDNVKLTVERHWHFSSSGVHKNADEEFTVKIDGEYAEKEEEDTYEQWQNSVVKNYFVPQELAKFFLFDGEMVRELARMEMETQVKIGIERLMGIPILTELKKDLGKYRTTKLSEIRTAGNEDNRKKLGVEISSLEDRSEELERIISDDEAEQQRITGKQNDRLSELASLGLTGSEDLKTLYEEKNEADVRLNQVRDNLQGKLVGEFAMALTGKNVIRSAIESLNSDNILEEWHTSKRQGAMGQRNFIKEIRVALQSKEDGIPSEFHSTVVSLIESTWSAIWYPKPVGCPDVPRFRGIGGSTRGAVLQRLNSLKDEAGKGVEEMLAEIDKLQETIKAKEKKIGNMESVGPRSETIVSELTNITEILKTLNARIGANEREKTAVDSDINRNRAALSQIASIDQKAKPVVTLTNTADRVEKLIGKLIKRIVPIQSSNLEDEMTKIYSELSSKNIVKKVTISPDTFKVKLLGNDDRDIRRNKMSAGEEQIFSQSLISAVVEVSSFDFPMVIDTPLARLDKVHRNSILNYFMSLNRQVIFLSTDTEIVNEYYKNLQPSVADSYVLSHKHDSGIGYTTASRGYFK